MNDRGEKEARRFVTEMVNRHGPRYQLHLWNKPLDDLRTATKDFDFRTSYRTLFRFAVVLSALDLAPGLRVLDFGGGPGWIGEWLARMGIDVTVADISEEMLMIARRRSELDQRIDRSLFHCIQASRRLPFADKSMDRVVLFDVFHHLTQQEEAMSEFWRVLNPGGRVVMAEPGRGHASALTSREEGHTTGTIEQSLEFEAVRELGVITGFDGPYICPVAPPDLLFCSWDEWAGLKEPGGNAGSRLVKEVINYIDYSGGVYFFVKPHDERTGDSTSSEGLSCEIRLRDEAPADEVPGGSVVSVPLLMTNTGTSRWLARPPTDKGRVRVGGEIRLSDSQRASGIQMDHVALRRDVAPGETIELTYSFAAPEERGSYTVELDLVSEHVAWFSNIGSKQLVFSLQVTSGSSHFGFAQREGAE